MEVDAGGFGGAGASGSWVGVSPAAGELGGGELLDFGGGGTVGDPLELGMEDEDSGLEGPEGAGGEAEGSQRRKKRKGGRRRKWVLQR